MFHRTRGNSHISWFQNVNSQNVNSQKLCQLPKYFLSTAKISPPKMSTPKINYHIAMWSSSLIICPGVSKTRNMSAMHIWEKKNLCNTSPKVTIRHLWIDRCNWCGGHHELHHVHGDMVLFRVLCVIRTRLGSHWWFRCTLLWNYLLQGHRVAVNMTWTLFRS